MRFRNLKTNTIEEPKNKEVEKMMLDCPDAFEKIADEPEKAKK